MSVKIQVRRGTKAQLTSYGPLSAGEFGFITDENLVYVGDGAANYLVGRVFYGNAAPSGTGVAGTMHVNTTTSGLFFSDGAQWIPVGFSHLADLQGTLDDIPDGVNYQRVAASEVDSSGRVTQISDGTHTVTAENARHHIEDVTIHRSINDSGSANTDLWSAAKILDELGYAIRGIDWQDSVKDVVEDNPGGSPVDGDRYLVSGTASGTWTANYIYEYITASGGWVPTVPNEGFATWVEDADLLEVYNGLNWTPMSSVTVHNNLSGLQGGTTGEYYHLTSAQHTSLTTDLTETVQDVVGPMASGIHTYIEVTYNDTLGTLDFILLDHDHSITGQGGQISHASLTNIGANDHHNQQHGLVSADHTVTTTSGFILRATGSNTFDFGPLQFSDLPAIQHSQLQGIGANDHHTQVHAFHGTDHSYGTIHAGNLLQVNVGETAPEWTDTVDGGLFT